MQDLTFS